MLDPSAACPLDELASSQCETVQPRKAAPFFDTATADETKSLIEAHHYSKRAGIISVARFCMRDHDDGSILCAAAFNVPSAKYKEPVIELVRLVRRPDYTEPLSRFLSLCLKALKQRGYDLLISQADSTHRHHGGIYQAANFRYHGQKKPANDGLIINGVFVPGRSLNGRYGTRSAAKVQAILSDALIEKHWDAGKYVYWAPLNRGGLRKAERLGLKSLSYPKPANDNASEAA